MIGGANATSELIAYSANTRPVYDNNADNSNSSGFNAHSTVWDASFTNRFGQISSSDAVYYGKFITAQSSGAEGYYDWCNKAGSTSDSDHNNTLWGVSPASTARAAAQNPPKTANDPCPAQGC
jgi:hypothetical protein